MKKTVDNQERKGRMREKKEPPMSECLNEVFELRQQVGDYEDELNEKDAEIARLQQRVGELEEEKASIVRDFASTLIAIVPKAILKKAIHEALTTPAEEGE